MGTIKHIGTARPRQSKTTRLIKTLFGQSKAARSARRRAALTGAIWSLETVHTTIAPILRDASKGQPHVNPLRDMA